MVAIANDGRLGRAETSALPGGDGRSEVVACNGLGRQSGGDDVDLLVSSASESLYEIKRTL